MTSSPYQSNLLRFAISQYRRGRDRHRRAVRQARGAATLGVSLGVALTVLPVYALIQASRLAGRRLKQSVYNMRSSSRLLGAETGATELIDLSDFGELPATSSMVRALMIVENCLSPAQVKLLKAVREQSSSLSVDRAGAGTTGQITAIASDTETRSLVLILGHKLAWRGLSAEQQQQLQAQIMRFVESSHAERSFFYAPTAFLPQSVKALPGQASGLVRPVLSFWVEVLKRVAQLQPQFKRFGRHIPQLPSGSGVLDSSPQLSLASGPALIGSNLQCALPVYQPAISTVKSFDSTTTADWEADVLAVDYIEHPLERLLKWVDRLLLWIENRWQGLFAVVADVLTGDWPDR